MAGIRFAFVKMRSRRAGKSMKLIDNINDLLGDDIKGPVRISVCEAH